MLQEAMLEGTCDGPTAELYAYGIYLAHGGRPTDFMDMTEEDVSIMLMVYTAEKHKDRMGRKEDD